MPAPDHIVFGGTFDPPHQGHVELVATAHQSFPEARISIVPSPSPAVVGEQKKHPASFSDRWQMCEDAFASVLSPTIELSAIETKLPAPHYTVGTLEYLHEQQPNARLGLLVGEDQFSQFTQWRNHNRILELAELIVVRRVGEQFLDTTEDIEVKATIIEAPICPASSTALRNAYSEGKEIPPNWIDPGVDRWIREHNLYNGELRT